MCKDANIQEKYIQALNEANYFRLKRQIEDAAIEEFVNYLKSTQVSADECVNMQYYLDAYCQEVDIKDSIRAFLGCEEGLND